MKIHPTVIVEEKSNISDNVIIGPYSIIEKDVIIGNNVEIGPYVHIKGNTKIGNNNKIYSGVIIGYEPQVIEFDSKKNVGIEIGNNNIIREHSTIHLATTDNNVTKIGNNNYLMVNTHIAHDCIIENNVTIVNNACLAGFIKVENNAFISGNAGIHQFCHIGKYSMVGANEKIGQDVVPFTLINDFPGKPVGINLVGLKRGGFTAEQIKNLNLAYKILFRKKFAIPKAIEILEKDFEDPNVKYIVDFVKESVKNRRGFIKYKE